MENIMEEDSREIVEDVELTISNPAAGTVIRVSDPDGLDQTPVPVVVSNSDKYSIGKINVGGIQRDEVFWKDYATLVYYPDETMEEGKTYTVCGKIKANEGYVFYDPVNLIVNGEEQPIDATEDYSLEHDEFVFYYDVEAVKE